VSIIGIRYLIELFQNKGIAMKKNICIDFDGVIHAYREGWKGETEIYDDPTAGCIPAIYELREIYRVVILSSRAKTKEGKDAIEQWLKKHSIPYDEVTNNKVPADIYVDDRGMQFKGNWYETIKEIENYDHWFRGKLR